MSKEQKYNNGQALYFIDFPGYEVYHAVNQVYEPTTQLYRINYRVPGVAELMFDDVPESSLITLAEVMTDENSVNKGLPKGFKNHSVPAFIFVAEGKLHVGTLNFDGKWLDQNLDEYVDEVTHWTYRSGFLDTGFGDARFYGERESMRDADRN